MIRVNKVDVDEPHLDLASLKMFRPATVNWSAIGSVTPEEARQFAKDIVDAADIASQLNATLKVKGLLMEDKA
jgi:hypothetical protein